MASPLKRIALTFCLDRIFRNSGDEFLVTEEQVIHVEPLKECKICAITMQKIRVSGIEKLRIDIKLNVEAEHHEWKVNFADFSRHNTGTHDWDLKVEVTKRNTEDNTYFDIPYEDNKIISGDKIDLHFSPACLGDSVGISEENITENRICRIGVI